MKKIVVAAAALALSTGLATAADMFVKAPPPNHIVIAAGDKNGAYYPIAQKYAEELQKEGIAVEVVDPRTLVPLDKQTILASVAKTGRLVTVDMAHKTCSAASEIAALVAMEGFWSLQAPIQRLGTANVHIPFSPALESLVYPTAETIAKAVRTTLE